MNKDDLKKFGLEDDDLIQKVLIEHGKGIEKFKADIAAKQQELDGLKEQLSEANKQIEADIAAKQQELDGLKEQLSEANKQIESFKDMDIEGVKKSADEWKAKFEQSQAEATAQIERLKFDHALEASLAGAKAKNPKAVRALLKEADLKLAEDGSIVGLTEQLEHVKSENDYLFESDEPSPVIVTGGGNKNIKTDPVIEAARKAAGLSVSD